VPTRELARQVHGVAARLAKWAKRPLETCLVVGGDGDVSRAAQATALSTAGVTLVVATPGRLLDLARASGLCRQAVQETTMLIIDEADRMLQLGFEEQLHELSRMLPRGRQTMLFTATFPLKLREAAAKWWARPAEAFAVTVRVNTLKLSQSADGKAAAKRSVDAEAQDEPPASDAPAKDAPAAKAEKSAAKDAAADEAPAERGPDAAAGADDATDKKKQRHVERGPTSLAQVSSDIVQTVHVCAPHKRDRLLLRFLDKIVAEDLAIKRRNVSRVLIFCNTAVQVKHVLELAQRHGHARVAILHGKLPQKERDSALLLFRAGKIAVLVATDLASRGLDVARLPYVVNWDFPPSLETYTHRVGRVGRGTKDPTATTPPTALSFFTRNLAPLAPSLVALLSATGQHVDPQLQLVADGANDVKPKKKKPEEAQLLVPPTPPDEVDDILLGLLRSVSKG